MENMFFDPQEQAPSNDNSGKNIFDNSENGNQHDLSGEGDEYEEGLDHYDDYDCYGGSGEKYGWYNGWSDDAIDDAFEGDPENTWNVD